VLLNKLQFFHGALERQNNQFNVNVRGNFFVFSQDRRFFLELTEKKLTRDPCFLLYSFRDSTVGSRYDHGGERGQSTGIPALLHGTNDATQAFVTVLGGRNNSLPHLDQLLPYFFCEPMLDSGRAPTFRPRSDFPLWSGVCGDRFTADCSLVTRKSLTDFLPRRVGSKTYGLAFRSHRWPGWRGPRRLRLKRTGSPIG
jgi:hypothetical protein